MLFFSTANAIFHLIFKSSEDNLAAQMSEESISKALKDAMGYPVMVNMSLEPADLGIIEEGMDSTNNSKQLDCSSSRQQQKMPLLPKSSSYGNCSTSRKPSPLSKDSSINTESQDLAQQVGMADIMRTTKPKHRWVSLSSIPQSDVCVEPYSQDILFENANTARENRLRKNSKFQNGPMKVNENHQSQDAATQL